MQTSALKNEKTRGNLGNFYTNDWEKRGKIRTNTLYLVSHHFQRSDRGPTGLQKQSQRNEPGFCPPIEPLNLKNKR